MRAQTENPVWIEDEAVAVYRVAEQHPKLEWINVPLVERLLFKVPQWSGKHPGRTYAKACDSVFRVQQLSVSGDGLVVSGKVGSFKSHTTVYNVRFGFRKHEFCPKYFMYSCDCPVGSTVVAAYGRPKLCKHIVAAMLDCCVDFDGSKGCVVLTKFAKALVRTVDGEDGHVVVERIVYRKLLADNFSEHSFGCYLNLCKIVGETWEDLVWISDDNFLSWEAHTQYSTLIRRMKTGIIRWWEC